MQENDKSRPNLAQNSSQLSCENQGRSIGCRSPCIAGTRSKRSYADTAGGSSSNPPQHATSNKLEEKIDRLIDQMGTLMNLLTTVINKLCQ